MDTPEHIGQIMRPLDTLARIPAAAPLAAALPLLRAPSGAPGVLALEAESGRPAGIVTPRELLAALEPEYLKPSAESQGYGEIDTELALVWDSLFTSAVQTRLAAPLSTAMRPLGAPLAATDPLAKAACLMIHRNLPLLWVEEEGLPAGIVLLDDVFAALADRLPLGEPA